jgi:hypothetical protein
VDVVRGVAGAGQWNADKEQDFEDSHGNVLKTYERKMGTCRGALMQTMNL